MHGWLLVGVVSALGTAQVPQSNYVDAGPSLHLKPVNDTTRQLVFINGSDRRVRVWQVALFDCANVHVECTVSDPRLDVAPGDTVALSSVTFGTKWYVNWSVSWRPAPPPDAAVYDLVVPASGPASLLVAPLTLAHESYRRFGTTHSFAQWEMLDLRHRIGLWLEQSVTPSGDTLHLQLMSARIPTDSVGHLVADDSYWMPIEQSDSTGAALLAKLGSRIEKDEMQAVKHPLKAADALHAMELGLRPATRTALGPRNLGNKRWALCRYSADLTEIPLVVGLQTLDDWCPHQQGAPYFQFNTFVVANPVLEPVGETLETCAAYTTNPPIGWDPVAWYSDPTRCPADGPPALGDQPNILVLIRRR